MKTTLRDLVAVLSTALGGAGLLGWTADKAQAQSACVEQCRNNSWSAPVQPILSNSLWRTPQPTKHSACLWLPGWTGNYLLRAKELFRQRMGMEIAATSDVRMSLSGIIRN